MAERDHRVDAGGPARGDVGRRRADRPEEEGDAEGEEAADSAGGTKSTKKGSTKKGSTKKGSTDAKAEGGAAAGDGGAAKAPPKEEKPKEEDVSVDCLLDPSKCKKGGSSKPSGGSSGGSSAPPAGGSQPAKLSADDIKAGIASAKSSAESKCKSKSKGGEKVVVKISIEGSSGKVLSATADGTPLGDCVASELKNAKFKTFSAPQQGAQVSVRF
ncbi:MAG: hypothetical protein KC420_01030 [Myxococcales bacterium]|nr:hypothetical protein [Myxococcales bacterium]